VLLVRLREYLSKFLEAGWRVLGVEIVASRENKDPMHQDIRTGNIVFSRVRA
jgi:hypothetical protein